MKEVSDTTFGTATYRKESPCYMSHPALPLGDYKIYGGSCSHPAVKDADIYIGFDYMPDVKSYPWDFDPTAPIIVHFPVQDMCAPKDTVAFACMVTWVCDQLRAGKKIHAGCIGGHGRTGTFFAAVVKEFLGESDAISYVRKNYCTRAVESDAQINFLSKHYGITPVSGSKAKVSARTVGALPTGFSAVSGLRAPPVTLSTSNSIKKGYFATCHPVMSRRCIWGRKIP